MQQLSELTVKPHSTESCAVEILETVPSVMRFIRTQMRLYRGADLSVPQFRTLIYVSRNPGASLSALAEHLDVSLPGTSRLVEGLVRKRLLDRRIPADNRRMVALSVSHRGQRTVTRAQEATVKSLVGVLEVLSDEEREAIQSSMRTLRTQFQSMGSRTGL